MDYPTSAFYYSVSGTDLDVDQIAQILARYGITNIAVRRGPISQISVELMNPTPEQLEVVQKVLSTTVGHQLRTFERRITPPPHPLTQGYPRIEELPSAEPQQYSTKRLSPIPESSSVSSSVSSQPYYGSPQVRGQIMPPPAIQFTVPSLGFGRV
jgi:hypothetical protein